MLQTFSPTASAHATPLASRRNSDAGIAVRGDPIGCVILDDLNSFANVQNTATIDKATKSAMRTAGRIQWCARDLEATVVVSDQSGTILEDMRPIEILDVKMKKKQVESLLDPNSAIPSLREVESMQQRRDMEKIREWFKSHPGVTTLAKILRHRNRFSGPVAGGDAWAFVDRDIKMMSYSSDGGWVTSEQEGSEGSKVIEFPHAVVEVQWDGKQTPLFIHELAQSHFVCQSCEPVKSEYSRCFYRLRVSQDFQ
jgi:SPX domain protein involved in polyphosphate accumulation